MKKRLFSIFLVLICVCSFSLSTFAKGLEDLTEEDVAAIKANPQLWYFQNQMLGVEKGTGVTLVCPNGDYSTLYTGGTLVSCPYDGEALVLASAGGVQAKKYETGGGSGDGSSGVGRRPSGYVDDTGTPSFNVDGNLVFYVPVTGWGLDSSSSSCGINYQHFHKSYNDGQHVTGTFPLRSDYNGTEYFKAVAYFTAPVSGKYYLYNGDVVGLIKSPDFASYKATVSWKSSGYVHLSQGDKWAAYCCSGFLDRKSSDSTYEAIGYGFHMLVVPDEVTVNKQTNITINQNVWNGNIYQDNSTNLTYIYPQYTTINENNETVTNISNNPIIYDSTTNQYYTYDTVTNNYYYITYETTTPTPTPGTDPTPTPTPGGDTGDTSSILDVLVEIRDNMIQGFADLKATLVQGWADLSANFTLAIENLNVNIQNFFNEKFPSETPEPSPTPSPTPDPSTAIPSVKPGATRDFIIPKMTDDSYTDGYGTWVATSSDPWGNDYSVAKVFDRDSSTMFAAKVDSSGQAILPCYIQIEIPSNESFYIDGYTFVPTGRFPTAWKLQGSLDGENWELVDKQSEQTSLQSGTYCDYPVSLHKAYKYYRLFVTAVIKEQCNIYEFNLYGYSKDDVTITYPSETPTPTPAPTDKPNSGGNTNNFWNFVFPGGSDDGTENGHKGILWALISLLIAVVTFVLGLGSAYAYVFPFLPAGLVTTIHICVLVLLLFAIIKFVRSFL